LASSPFSSMRLITDSICSSVATLLITIIMLDPI